MLYSRSLTADINHLSVLVRMDQFVCVLPTPLLFAFLDSSVIDVTDNATRRYPNNGSDDYHSSHYIIFQETHDLVDVYVFDDVPKSFHHILNRFLAYTLRKKEYMLHYTTGQVRFAEKRKINFTVALLCCRNLGCTVSHPAKYLAGLSGNTFRSSSSYSIFCMHRQLSEKSSVTM